MAKPLMPPEQWDALKTLSIKGLSDSKLADAFGVSVGAIQSRRFDDPIWAAAKKDQITQRGRPSLAETKAKEQASEQVLSISGASLAEIGEQNSLLLARYTAQKIKNSVDADLLPDPEDWSQIKTASEILRKATGQDRDQPAVSVNLFSASQFYDDASPTFDADVIETEPENAPDFC
jgi:hypothetical protein